MNSLGAGGNGFDSGGQGPSDAIAFPNIYQLFGSAASAKVSQIQGNLSAWATSQAGSALSAAALQEIYQVQADLIIDHNGMSRPPTSQRLSAMLMSSTQPRLSSCSLIPDSLRAFFPVSFPALADVLTRFTVLSESTCGSSFLSAVEV